MWTAFGNVMLGIPFGGQKGFGIRPYGLVGIGAVRPDGDAFATQFELSENKVGWDFGGGVMMFFTSHVGIRGDIRYFRTFEALDFLDTRIRDRERPRRSRLHARLVWVRGEVVTVADQRQAPLIRRVMRVSGSMRAALRAVT